MRVIHTLYLVGLHDRELLPAKILGGLSVDSYHATEQIEVRMVRVLAGRTGTEEIVLALESLRETTVSVSHCHAR